jgi:hypothetical protein
MPSIDASSMNMCAEVMGTQERSLSPKAQCTIRNAFFLYFIDLYFFITDLIMSLRQKHVANCLSKHRRQSKMDKCT